MPIYEYACARCKRRREVLRKVAERDAPATCTTCGRACVRVLFPGANVGRFSKSDGRRTRRSARGTGIRIEGPAKVAIEDSTFIGLKRGIVAHKDAQVSLKGTKFRDVELPIERERK